MKKLIFLLLILPFIAPAQNNHAIDSLKLLLSKAKVDTQKVNLLNKIGDLLINTKGIEGVKYANEAILQSEKIGFKKGLAQGYANRGEMLFNTNKPDSAKSDLETAIKFYKQTNDLAGLALTYNTLGRLVRVLGKLSDAIGYFQEAASIYEKINNQEGISDCLVFIGNNYN
jgi:tetratricopeptide (TPR) repeat protein